jgi:hypothetical protein
MVGVDMTELQYNEVIEASLRRLRAMGLDVHLLPESNNECFIFIRLSSLVDIIRKQVTYQNKKITLEKDFIVIYLWRKP